MFSLTAPDTVSRLLRRAEHREYVSKLFCDKTGFSCLRHPDSTVPEGGTHRLGRSQVGSVWVVGTQTGALDRWIPSAAVVSSPLLDGGPCRVPPVSLPRRSLAQSRSPVFLLRPLSTTGDSRMSTLFPPSLYDCSEFTVRILCRLGSELDLKKLRKG